MTVTHPIDPQIFRAYDIRGIVDETLHIDTMQCIGQALGSMVLEKGDHQLAVARDGRLSSETLSHALIEGILSTGCDAIDIGMVPTPLLYYVTHMFDQRSGVMVTGSHNSSEYNGLKIVYNQRPLAGIELQGLYQRCIQEKFIQGQGFCYQQDISDRYIAHIKHDIRLQRPLKVIVDSGNGVAGKIAPLLYRRLGCEVNELFCDIDGQFPNHHPDPGQYENLRFLCEQMKTQQADIGLAFDGDGDRLGVVTKQGNIINADQVLMIFAESVINRHPGAKIIYDVKCSNQVGQLITKCGGEAIMWKTGHSLIKAKLSEVNALLAGEMSGHFFFKDRWFGFDDALYAGARLLELMTQPGAIHADIFANLPSMINTPELKVAVEEGEKFKLVETLINQATFDETANIQTLDGLRVDFSQGWGLIRASNTSPYLVCRFEAMDNKIMEHIQNLFRDLLLSVKPGLVLPF